jgi:retron-type reverse transcriptase
VALIHLVNKITSASDRKETTAWFFLELSKAFDTIDHDILFDKLEHYGISGIALTWIKSYFLERKQFVEFNETCSSEQTIKCGVPQGSILGPLFVIIYIDYLPNACKVTEILIFADDTSIFYSHSDPKHLESVMNEELKKVDVWMNFLLISRKQITLFLNQIGRQLLLTFLSALVINYLSRRTL